MSLNTALRNRRIGPAFFQALNWPVGLGASALLLAAGLALIVTPRWHAERDAADLAARRLAATPRAATPAAAVPTDELRLLAALPTADAAAQRMADLLALAAQRGLVVQSTRQSLPAAVRATAAAAPRNPTTGAADPAATPLPVQALRLSMGVQGRYEALRRFVAEALQHDDALLLDQTRLLRATPQARELSAELQWSLLQREPACSPALPGGRLAAADSPGTAR